MGKSLIIKGANFLGGFSPKYAKVYQIYKNKNNTTEYHYAKMSFESVIEAGVKSLDDETADAILSETLELSWNGPLRPRVYYLNNDTMLSSNGALSYFYKIPDGVKECVDIKNLDVFNESIFNNSEGLYNFIAIDKETWKADTTNMYAFQKDVTKDKEEIINRINSGINKYNWIELSTLRVLKYVPQLIFI